MSIKIAFITILAFSSIIAPKSGVVQKLDNGQNKNTIQLQKCYSRPLSIYFQMDSDNDFTASLATPETKLICPTLEQTCCSADQLTQQFAVFKENYLVLRNYFKNQEEIIAKLKELKFVATIPKEDKTEESESEDIEKKPVDRSHLYGVLLHYLQSSYDQSHHLNYTISSYYSGFLCQFCHPESNAFFPLFSNYRSRDNRDFDREDTKWQFDVSFFNEYFKLVTGVYKYKLLLSNANKILVQIAESQNSQGIMAFPDMNPEALSEYINYCESILGDSVALSKSKCFETIQQNKDIVQTMSGFEEISKFFFILNEHMFLNFGLLQFATKKDDYFPVAFNFALQNEKMGEDLEQYRIKINTNKGFSMVTRKISESLWYLFAQKSVASVIAIILFVFVN